MFFLLLEVCVAILVAVFVTTNVILPAVHQTKLFPWFRRRNIDRALIAANDDISIAQMEERIKRARAHADAIRNAQSGESANE